MSNIKVGIIEILEKSLSINTEIDFNYEFSFNDNNLDSLSIIELVMECEKKFNIHIDEDLLSTDSKFIDLEAIIEKELQMKTL